MRLCEHSDFQQAILQAAELPPSAAFCARPRRCIRPFVQLNWSATETSQCSR